MKKTITITLLGLALLCGCTSGAKRDFNRLLVELAADDGTIDGHDWEQITAFLDKQKAHFKDFYDDGKLDTDDVEEYITDFFAHRRPPKEIRFTGIGNDRMSFRIYIERSGSMTAYDSPKGDGSFRAAIMALQNALPGKVRADSVGEKGYTDFRKIFDDLLNNTPESQVSIMATDLIYSVRDMQGVNPQKVFAEMQQMTDAVFKGSATKKAMLIVRMMGSYNGPYYSYDNSVKRYDGQRPWYIIIVGSDDNMRRLTTDPALRTFASLESLRGYDGMCLLTKDDIYSPHASFLLSGGDVRGRFRPERGQQEQILRLNDLAPDRDSGDLQLALAVDLGNMLIDKDYLTDKANYDIVSDGDITLKEIRPIKKGDISAAEKKYAGTATHLFILNVKNVGRDDEVELRLRNELPRWVTTGSTDNDMRPDSRTTFGLRYLMQGIYDSYARNNDDKPAYFEIEMHLDK